MAIGKHLGFVLYTAYGIFIYAICAGFRDTYGIMLPYISAEKGFTFASVSFVIAIGQLCFGFMQPAFAYFALIFSSRAAFLAGATFMLAGLALIPLAANLWLLLLALGILLPSGTASASFGLLMNSVAPKLNPGARQISGGLVASGIGLSICLLSPIIQQRFASQGLHAGLLFLGLLAVLLYPISILLTAKEKRKQRSNLALGFGSILKRGFASPAYRLLIFAFFMCGIHMALIQTHLFSQLRAFGIADHLAAYGLSIYGIGVISGAVLAGAACVRFPMAIILGLLIGSRVIWVGLLLLSLSAWAIFIDIFLLGLTGVATLTPVSGLINRIFGVAIMPTLFGMAYVIHQIGAFCSAWSGGLCFQLAGSYSPVWAVDILLNFLAAIACFAILKYERASSEQSDPDRPKN